MLDWPKEKNENFINATGHFVHDSVFEKVLIFFEKKKVPRDDWSSSSSEI